MKGVGCLQYSFPSNLSYSSLPSILNSKNSGASKNVFFISFDITDQYLFVIMVRNLRLAQNLGDLDVSGC